MKWLVISLHGMFMVLSTVNSPALNMSLLNFKNIYISIPLTLFIHIVEALAEPPEDKLLTLDSAVLL